MKHRILIVDDSALMHQLIEAHLKEAGYEVLHAHDGFEAINATLREMPDLVVLDVNMPKINGWQVCRFLKDHAATKHIPIIIGTSLKSAVYVSDPRQWSVETGADDYFDKDLETMPSLLEIVKKQLGGASPRGKPSQAYAPLSEMEISSYLSRLLDAQLYKDITRLKELDERKNAFVANVAHEFRSPLAIISAYLSAIETGVYGPVAASQKPAIESSLQTVNRLTRLVNDLLDLSKIEAGKMELRREKIDMPALLDEVLKAYALPLQNKKIELRKEVARPLSSLQGDKDRLMQVVINLVYNAIKFVPEGSRITLRLSEEGQNLRLEVEDNGPGIAGPDLEKIFDKFERLSADKKEGTGLGLPISKDIVKLHKGRIWVESETGKGSKFVVLLPSS